MHNNGAGQPVRIRRMVCNIVNSRETRFSPSVAHMVYIAI